MREGDAEVCVVALLEGVMGGRWVEKLRRPSVEDKTAVDDVAVKDVVIYVSVSNWVLSPALADVAQRLYTLHHAFSRNLRLRLQNTVSTCFLPMMSFPRESHVRIYEPARWEPLRASVESDSTRLLSQLTFRVRR